MDKTEFIKQATETVKEEHNRPLRIVDMEKALQAFCSVAAAELLAGGEVSLPGLGKLKVKETNARTGRNPRTGEAIEIPAGRKVVFSPGKDFKEALHG
ncbi:HU family DNA-binding protein [Bilophila wadsworthia]|uniref:HU family DNA-binding protein n=1 Tax=Bilophila wadsworthia TaxID=35833 RepID=UPI0032608D71